MHVLGDGERTVVFAHGFGTDQTAWRHLAPRVQRDCRVVLFDHMGFGRSDRAAYDDARHGSLDGYAADVIDILRALGLRDVVFVGHSIGGIIGMLASLIEPERFARLVLLNTSPSYIDHPPDYVGGFQRRQIGDMLDLMQRDHAAWADFLAPVAIGRSNDPAQIRAFGEHLHSLDPLITQRFAKLVFYVDCRRRLPQVTTPALVLQSRQDDFVPMTVAEHLARALPRATLVPIEATGHCPHLTHPELVLAAAHDALLDAG